MKCIPSTDELTERRRLVFITGASRGIGKGIAEKLIQSGYDVIIGYYRNRERAVEIAKKYVNCFAVRVDISKRRSIVQAVKTGEEHFKGCISILINNAAIAQEKPFETITDNDWDLMMAINLRGAFACCQEVLPGMLGQGWGRIVNLSSIGGQWGGTNQVHYAVSKAGLICLTKSLSRLYSGGGITVNAVAPGLVKTDMTEAELKTRAGKDKIRNIPIGRIASVKEIADTVAFLVSEDAGYITGQTINVNGGMYCG